ncbi:MAG: recombinase RecT [Sediminibacterium sp.]
MSETTTALQTNGQATEANPLKSLFARDDVKKKFTEMLGKRSAQFITSVLQIAASSLPANTDPLSVYNSAAVAATLDLPLNNNLGFAYIVAFNQKQKDGNYKPVAQFQLGYRGYIQLAQRSGQFLTINAKPVYEGQLIEDNSFDGFHFDWKHKKENAQIIGYAAYFKLLNGFEKTLFMTVEDLKAHGTKYSQTFKKGFGLWKDDFDAMAIKTVLKLLLGKYAPLSVEMQKAVVVDSSIINNEDATDVTYVDNTEIIVDASAVANGKERERIKEHIAKSKNEKQLMQVIKEFDETDSELVDVYNNKMIELSNSK